MRRLSYANVMATIAVVLAAGGGSFAIAQSGSSDTIRGCMHKKTGVLRALASGKKCKRTERALSWNVEGRAGADGLDGADGAPGANGRDGAVGPTGPRGADGARGADGDAGPTGPRGDDGLAGPAGPTGPKGDAGSAGPAGPTGPKGDMGPPGPTGPQGSPDTASQVLQKLVTVDGPGSGLNADLFDGLNSTEVGRKIGSAFVSIGYGAESYDDPGECSEQVLTTAGLFNIAIGDLVVVNATRNADERAPANGLMVMGFIAERLEGSVEVPRVYIRVCNVTESIIESVQLNFRVMVLR